MKKQLLAGVICAFMAVPSFADQTASTERVSGYYSGTGGEFTVTPGGGLENYLSQYGSETSGVPSGHSPYPTATFQTFCIEKHEYVSSYWQMHDATISNRAMQGGVGPQGDPISRGTAWLYHEFQNGALPGYDYTPGNGRSASAGALQDTIWWLEDEVSDPGTGNTFRQAVVTQFGGATNAKADNNWTYPVAALNLWETGYVNQTYHQDMLVSVPVPGAVLLGSIGLSVAGWRLRRKTA